MEHSLGTDSSDDSGDGGSVMPDDPRWVTGDVEQVFVIFLLDLVSTLDEDALVNLTLDDSQVSGSSGLSHGSSLGDGESLSDDLSGSLSSDGLSLGDLDLSDDSVLLDHSSVFHSSEDLFLSDDEMFLLTNLLASVSLGDSD